MSKEISLPRLLLFTRALVNLWRSGQKTEAGLRSPLRNPASSHGRHQTTELNFVLIHYRREEIEAGSRSPLHNPASTHGRHKKTAELKLILIHLPISMTKMTERGVAAINLPFI
ncbi:MAG TPA: hypothetical protein VN956_23010 [Pyrinomonadaceae bacterium]|nr:hypothetical protein [Pyrinomonadaceae bacterium]